MNYPHVTLGGVPITAESGGVAQEYGGELGETEVRLSLGDLITMAHWRKETITLSGAGWFGPGFDGLDFRRPLELRCTEPREMQGAVAEQRDFELPSVPRPDVAPWAYAWVDGQWREIGNASYADGVATAPAVPDALLYRVHWMPTYWVKANLSRSTAAEVGARRSWTITCREI